MEAQLQKKRVLKEDGRYLIYYHFPETATADETVVFDRIDAAKPADATGEAGVNANVAIVKDPNVV